MFFTISLLSQLAIGQPIEESVSYINYTVTNGLPSNETYDVFQDSRGYIWIGTDKGVVKYDGHTFKTYTTRDGLTDNTVFRIQEDFKGRIWFITYNRRLCYLENGTFKKYLYNKQLLQATKQLAISSTITDFHIDELNNVNLIVCDFLTIKITSKGVVSISELTKTDFLRYRSFNSINQIGLLVNELKNKFNFEKSNIKSIFSSVEFSTKIHIVVEDSNIFCGANNGLYISSVSPAFKTRYILPEFQITGIVTDIDNGLWCSTLKDGVIYIPNPSLIAYKVPVRKMQHIHGIIPQNNHLVFSFDQAPTSLYMTNNENSSIVKTNDIIKTRQIPNDCLQTGIKFASTIYLDNFVFRINTVTLIDSSKIMAFSGKSGFLILTPNKPTTFPHASNDHFKYDPRFLYPKNHSHIINLPQITAEDGYKKLWNVFNEKSYAQKVDDPDIINRWLKKFNSKVTTVFKASNNKIWVGTIDGLQLLNIKNQTLQRVEINRNQSISVQDIIETKDSSLFIATKVNGIYIRKENFIDSITINSGLLSNTINQVLYDSENNKIWVATNKGMDILKKKNDKWVIEHTITKYDGIKSANIEEFRFQDNFLYFVIERTIYKIDTNTLNYKINKPFIYISSLNVENSLIQSSNKTHLSYDSNNIQINYRGISYKSQNDIIYKYQLSPINDTWQTTTNDNIIFNALPPDDYTLQLKAINIDGVESEIKTMHFSIIPAFWMTWWFKSFVIILAIILGYKLSIKTIQTYKSQAQFQRTINEMQIISLQSKMNPHFIFNSLNSIQNYILKNEKTNANQYLLEFSKLIRTILQNSDSTTISLQSELETLKMYVNLEKKRIRKEFKYTEDIDSEIDMKNCIIPSLLIQPYIENAIWHGKVYSNPNGEIKLSILKKENTLFIEICDNGIGIKNAEASKVKKTKHKSLGTSVTKKRIELLSELNNEMSDVTISEAFRNENDNIYVGTRITFNIPYVLKF